MEEVSQKEEWFDAAGDGELRLAPRERLGNPGAPRGASIDSGCREWCSDAPDLFLASGISMSCRLGASAAPREAPCCPSLRVVRHYRSGIEVPAYCI